MKRPFPRFEVLGLTVALVGVACTPNNSVQPGAPVLMEMEVVENGGYNITTVTAMTSGCPAGTTDGVGCASADPACQQLTTNILCHCVAGATPTTTTTPADAGAADAGAADAGMSDAAATPKFDGAWSCSFAPTATVLYVFDRLLYTPPLEPGDSGTVSDLSMSTFDPQPTTPVALLGDYASNGSPNEVVFPLLGDFRSDGPSILFAAAPTLPSNNTITVTLDKTKVLAKDGRTPFTGSGPLIDGTLKFFTTKFIATVAGPPAPMGAADAAPMLPLPDMTPATVVFSNLIDPATIGTHITVGAVPTGSAAGTQPTPVAVDVASMDGINVTITPKATWPASSDITITVDAATADLVGDTLGTATPATFSTSAM